MYVAIKRQNVLVSEGYEGSWEVTDVVKDICFTNSFETAICLKEDGYEISVLGED